MLLKIIRFMIQATIRGVRLATILLASYWFLLFVATHMPKAPTVRIHYADKIFHFGAYAGLAFLLAWAIPNSSRYRFAHVCLAALLAISYGAIDECLQIPVGRTAEFQDWLADALGAIVGVLCYGVTRWQLIRLGIFQPIPSTKTLPALRA